MSIYLKLFLTFLEVGAFSFGGGYGMISVIREKCLINGWLTEEGLINFIAVAESTPGPIAVNMATFVGSSQGGFLGALLATLGIVLPSFVVILLIATVMKRLMRYAPFKAALSAISPVIIGLILVTGASMLSTVLIGVSRIGGEVSVDVWSVVIFALIVIFGKIFKKIKKRSMSPIAMILISAALGVLFFGVLS